MEPEKTTPGIAVTAADSSGEAQYLMTFRLGPRDYKNFMGAKENLGAGTLRITGDITDPDGPIAFCADTVPMLPSAAALATPITFAADVKRMDYTRIQVTCVGPVALAPLQKGSAVGVVRLSWTATATVDADRDTDAKSFAGSQTASLAEH